MRATRFLLIFLAIIACILLWSRGSAFLPSGITKPAEAETIAPSCIAEFPCEISSNKPFVQVRINDSAPYWFILDTGSSYSSTIDWNVAASLGLKIEGEKATHVGAGEGIQVKMGGTSGIDFDIHGLKLVNQPAAVVELGHVSEYEGRYLDGTVGYNFISLYVVEIDYANDTIRLYNPASYEYSGSGRVIPFEFISQLPAIRGALSLPGMQPVAGTFVVDTGTRMAILLNTPFVEKNKLLDAKMKFLYATVGGGVGGESKGYVGRIDGMQLGPFLAPQPVVVFLQDKSGVIASGGFDGIIGGALLRRTKVIFDYSRRQLILEPYAASPKPYEYDMSGLFLIGKGPDFRQYVIQSVMDDSPGANAGLQRGDIITTINESPAREYTLGELRELLTQEGREIKFEIQRDEKQISANFVTRRLI